MEVPSAKTHSVLTPLGLVLRTFRWHTFRSGLILAWSATPIATRTLAPAEHLAKRVGSCSATPCVA